MRKPPYPNKTGEYRVARKKLLEAEVALRQQIEDLAALRRSLPLISPCA